MNLYLLRHGIAVEPGAPGYATDADRPLLPKGERKLEEIAKAMAALELSFDLILSSPYRRANQTAELIAGSLKLRKRVEFCEDLTPGGSPKRVLERLTHLDPVPENVLLVGHEPYLSDLISLLLSGESGLSIVMKKGGLCKLSADQLRFGPCASLEWLATPKQMALMA
jgi:phosphohistidine phosphatase